MQKIPHWPGASQACIRIVLEQMAHRWLIVGPIVALSFIATIDDATRFRRAVDVGEYLGSTPRRDQSGETDWSGRIFIGKAQPIEGVGKAACETQGLKTAKVATARKMTVIPARLWRDGTEFAWTKEALPA